MRADCDMLKIVLCSRRHPRMTRPEFFAHLTAVHAPLVLGAADFLPYLQRYVQNHAILPEDGTEPPPSYRHAAERDSVIELWFESVEMLQEAMRVPQYLSIIRPDEGRFNDLDRLVAVPTHGVTVFSGPEAPPWKLFDFLVKREGMDRETFLGRWREDAMRLAADDSYRTRVRKRVHNVPLVHRNDDFAIASPYDGVTELWLDQLTDLDSFTPSSYRSGESQFVDASRSFSVIAKEVPVHDAVR